MKAFIVPTLDNEAMLDTLIGQVPLDFDLFVFRGKGVTEAWNEGLREASYCRYFVISNDDIELSEGWWEKFEEAFKTHHFVSLQTPHPFSGWFFAMDKYCLERIGYFDENMSIFAQDDDYAIRLKLAGIQIAKVDVPIKHYGSATVNKMDREKRKEIRNENWLALRKKYPNMKMQENLR